MAIRFPTWICTAACATLLLASGCEEHVVGVRNQYVGHPINRTGSSTTTITSPPPRSAPPAGFLDQLGESLLGWTRVFEEPEPYDPRRGSAIRISDPRERMSRPVIKSSE